jgi:hypothetical protein
MLASDPASLETFTIRPWPLAGHRVVRSAGAPVVIRGLLGAASARALGLRVEGALGTLLP